MTRPTASKNDSPTRSALLEERLRPYLWAVLAVSAGLTVRQVLTPALGSGFPFITLFPAVFVVAYLGGFGPALVATVLSVVAAFYLFIEPRFSLSTIDSAAWIGLGLFALSGLMTGWLGESRIRLAQKATRAVRMAEAETSRAEEEALRAEEEATRAEEETLRAAEETARAEEEGQRAAREAARVERILGSITDAFVVLDRQWTITYMNEQAAALTERTAADLVGRNLWEAFPDLPGGPFEKAFRQAMTEHAPARVEAYYPPIQKWIQASAYPAAEGLTVVAQDVTDRMRVHEATTRLAAIVASSEDAIIGKGLDGTILSWNAAAERIFGYTAAEIVGQPIYRLIPPELHEQEHDVLRRISQGQPVKFSQAERIRKDGERIHIALSVSPIRDPAGKVVGVSSIKRDITAQMRTEAALAEADARSLELAQALDAAQAMVRSIDGTISYWSNGSSRLYGWMASEAVGRVSHELLQTEFPMALEKIHALLLAQGQWEGELVHLAKDGRRLHAASQWILRRGEMGRPPSIIEVNTDVTARRQAEERIRQSERMEVVGQLAGGVAHEANNQMTVILGASEFLLARADLDPVARKDLEQIQNAAERTASITAQLLAFSRRQVLQPRVIVLDEVIAGLDGVMRRALGEQSTLHLQLGAGAGRVKADPGQLAQVLLNLVLNARDAMPLGGRVTIETTMTELSPDYALGHPGVEIEPGPYVLLSVGDTGHGMSGETLRRIFEPFYTTKPVGQGTGLGLATVYGIIKQSSGYVWAYSEPGHGTTFKVYLPVEPGALLLPPELPPPARASGEYILVVEDEPTVRAMTSRALQEHGYRVVEASGGQEALKLIEFADQAPDLIITDVIIPDMDGTEFARRAALLRPGLPVLFMSGYTDDDIIRRGLLDGKRPFLQKPFTPDVLIRRVAELLRR